MPLIAKLTLGLALAAAFWGCGDGCAEIHQLFVLDSPDSDLQALVDDCVANRACLPLCQRVLEISGEFPGTSSIDSCFFDPPSPTLSDAGADAGAVWAGTVDVIYRPSSCP